MKKLKLGFVGCGYMGQLAHIENYAKLSNVELIALAEGREKLAKTVAQRYGIKKIYPNHRELCSDNEVEAVVAIVWFTLNYGIARDLLSAGKHVATEKAMCLTVEGAEELAELAESRGLVYQVCYMKRFDPGIRMARQKVREMAESGEFGPLLYARIWCCHGDWQFQSYPPLTTDEPAPDYGITVESHPEWMTDEDFKWVNSWLNYYSHQTNLLRYVLGEDYNLKYFHQYPHGELGLVETTSGIPAFLEFPHYRVSQWDEGFQVFFERAVVRTDIPAPLARQHSAQVRIYENGETPRTVIPDVPPRWAMAEQAKSFVTAVLEGGEQISPPREAAKEIAFANSIIRWHRANSSRQ